MQGSQTKSLKSLKREKFVEVKSQQAMGLGEGSYQYAITGAGIARAREALDRSQYAGPAPVPIQAYNEAILRQSRGRTTLTHRALRQALASLVISDKSLQRIGPAVNSGTSIFLYGPPGNGKTIDRPRHRQHDPDREHVHPLRYLYRWPGGEAARYGEPPVIQRG